MKEAEYKEAVEYGEFVTKAAGAVKEYRIISRVLGENSRCDYPDILETICRNGTMYDYGGIFVQPFEKFSCCINRKHCDNCHSAAFEHDGLRNTVICDV